MQKQITPVGVNSTETNKPRNHVAERVKTALEKAQKNERCHPSVQTLYDGVGMFLLDAAYTLEKYGWIRGSLGNERRGFCAIGALNHVKQSLVSSGVNPIEANYLYALSKDRIVRHLTRSPRAIRADIACWNDIEAKGATEVIEMFKLCAKEKA